jgi:zinc transport system substrate-binding protein
MTLTDALSTDLLNLSVRQRGSMITRIITVTALAAVLLTGCSKKKEVEVKNFEVVTSFYPIYIIAKNISLNVPGTHVVNMTPPITGCLHDYSLTSEDMKHLEKANLFITNGAGMESFLEKTAAKFKTLKTVQLSKDVDLIKEGNTVNPHIWLNTKNAIKMTETCTDAFIDIDPAHKDLYATNGKRYSEKLLLLQKEMESSLQPFRGRKIITFHEAFPYFAQQFKLVIAAVIEREPGSEPSAKDLAQTISIVRASGIKTLFTEPQYPSRAAQTIAHETGASIYILDPAVTGANDPDAYISIMKNNLKELKRAFE